MCGKKFFFAGLAAGLAITVIAQAVGFLVQYVLPFNILSLGGMRAVSDPLMMAFFLHGWVLAFALTLVYPYFSFKGDFMAKGKKFGLLMWLAVSLPSIFLVYTSMDYPLGFHVSSLVSSIIYMPVAGIIIAKLKG